MRTFTSLLLLPSENFFVLFGTIQYTNFEHSHSGSQRFPSLHKSISNSNSSWSSTHTVYSDSFLSRRFSDQGFRSTNSCFPNGNGNSAFSKSGFFYILEEVGVDSFSEFSVSRRTLQNRPGSHFSTRGKIGIPLSENSVVPKLSVRNSQTVFSTARFP